MRFSTIIALATAVGVPVSAAPVRGNYDSVRAIEDHTLAHEGLDNFYYDDTEVLPFNHKAYKYAPVEDPLHPHKHPLSFISINTFRTARDNIHRVSLNNQKNIKAAVIRFVVLVTRGAMQPRQLGRMNSSDLLELAIKASKSDGLTDGGHDFRKEAKQALNEVWENLLDAHYTKPSAKDGPYTFTYAKVKSSDQQGNARYANDAITLEDDEGKGLVEVLILAMKEKLSMLKLTKDEDAQFRKELVDAVLALDPGTDVTKLTTPELLIDSFQKSLKDYDFKNMSSENWKVFKVQLIQAAEALKAAENRTFPPLVPL